MKLTKLFSALAILTITFAFNSCSKPTPVKQFTDALNSITEKIDKATSLEDLNDLGKDMENADQIVKDNAGYVLTDEDKTAISDALVKLSVASFTKNAKLHGFETTEMQTAIIEQSLKDLVSNATTLGNLNDNSMAAEESIEMTETAEPAAETTDSIE